MNKLKLLDLFSGIGGFSYALEQTQGFETIAFCEKDAFCQKVLQKHWNNIKIYDDIRDIKGSTIKADIVTGGFPCQPFSVAGKQRGTDDDRYLWDETIRVVAETKPKWFIGENVDGLVNISEGKVLQQIQKDLEAESFQVQCLIIPASGIGAWHQRKRIWIVGYSEHNGSLSNSENWIRQQTKWQRRKSFRGRSNDRSWFENERSKAKSNVPNSEILRHGRRSGEECRIKERKLQQTEQKRSSFRSEAERCSSQDDTSSWWQTQSKLCGVPNGISYGLDKDRTNRIKSLGNSIVPEIVKELGLAILAAENE